MKKVIISLLFCLASYISNAQASKIAKELYTYASTGRPSLMYVFQASDKTHELVFYKDNSVSYCTGKKCTEMFTTYKIEKGFVIDKGRYETNDTLYVLGNMVYFNKAMDVKYNLIKDYSRK